MRKHRNNDDEYHVTRHAKHRIKERMGLKAKSIDRIAQDALKNGVTVKEAKSGLKKYLNKIYMNHQSGGNLRVYHQKIFVFTDTNVLITILQLPQFLCKFEQKALMERERNKGGNEIDYQRKV